MEKHMIGRCIHCRGPVCPHESWVASDKGGVAHSECEADVKRSADQTGKYLYTKMKLSA